LTAVKAPIIDGLEFSMAEHDLKAIVSTWTCHAQQYYMSHPTHLRAN